MASVVTRKTGLVEIQFRDSGKQQAIRLGRIAKRDAELVRVHVEKLLAARTIGAAMPADTAAWLSELPPDVYAKLAAKHLVAERVSTLADLIDRYLDSLDRRKPGTRNNAGQATECLLEFFGAGQLISRLGPDDAQRFRRWLQAKPRKRGGGTLAEATVSRRIRACRTVFEYACKPSRKWIERNPFEEESGWCEVNHDRDYFVSRKLTRKLWDASHDYELRAIIALARVGGLRCPSEVLPMKWDQVLWDQGRVVVRAPKTEHHGDQGIRHVPLWKPLRKYLAELLDQADERQPLLFPRHQISNAALTDQLDRLCRTLGRPLWPKPWQNMRSSRETELLNKYPIGDVAEWMGHSPEIALKHYRQKVRAGLVTARS